MKVRSPREHLLQAFQVAAAVVPSRSTKDILRNVKLEVTEDGGNISGTDLEVGIQVALGEVEVLAPGTVLLPVDRFGSILRECGDDALEIESDGQTIRICGASSQFQLPSSNPDEYPPVPKFEEESYFQLSAPLLRQLVRRTVFATETESSRYALGGVLLEFAEKTVTAVGTDGRRLARQEGPIERVGEPGDEQMPIIPARAMTVIERALGDNEEAAQVAARANDVLIRAGGATLYSRLVEGRFPRWRDVFPRDPGGARIELPVGAFHSAVRQAAIVTSEERRGVEFNFADGKVTLTAHGAERGESLVEMPISYDGEQQAVDLDPRYVSDFLRVLDQEKTFTMELRGSDSAAVCVTDDGYGYVIMPLARERR